MENEQNMKPMCIDICTKPMLKFEDGVKNDERKVIATYNIKTVLSGLLE